VLTGSGSQVTLWNLSLWIHSPGSGVTLLLRFGAVVSTVGWNVLGLQPVGVFFYKDKCSLLWYYLSVYECIRCVFIYRLIESLEYACLLVIVVHVIRYFLLCILINLKRYR
jgi:hypothetical protein